MKCAYFCFLVGFLFRKSRQPLLWQSIRGYFYVIGGSYSCLVDTHKWQSEWEYTINQTIGKVNILIFVVPLPFLSLQRKVLYKIFSQSWHKKIALLSQNVLHFCICKSTWRTTTKPFSHIAGPSALALEAAEKMRRDHFKWNLNETSAKNVMRINSIGIQLRKKIFCTPKKPPQFLQ